MPHGAPVLRAVIFDLDDTLIPEAGPWREALAAVCGPVEEAHGLPAGVLAEAVQAIASARYEILEAGRGFSARFGVSWEECLWGPLGGASARQLPGLAAVAGAVRKTTWADALDAVGARSPELARELDRRYEAERRRSHRAFPTSGATVAALRDRGLLVGCVTNGASEIQREKLRRSGVEPWFDVTLVSGEEGVGKPDPGILELACERLGVTADEAVYVGNSPTRDVACAEAAGMRSVLVLREQEPAETGRLPAPRAVERAIHEIHGLLGFVDGWRAVRAFRIVDPDRRPVSIDLPEARPGGFAARAGPERDPLRPWVAGESPLRTIEAGLRGLRARAGAGEAPWRHELGEPVDWDAILR
jgi:putative hydrolase of the HAD superfamily